ncbi:MAG TPA: mechanosensitive ion channel domain-containing protein [Thermoplasmata archaeon]|jgi:small-conductance mechanosensitive channel|nr:mechanosensitive ion channel domain-containing protein [Thermoplasmata archaeon]
MFGLPNWVLPYLGVLVILALTWLIAFLAGLLLGRLMRHSAPQLAAAARRLGPLVVWTVGLLLAVQEAGLSIEILAVVVVLVGLAAIVALRQPLENLGAKYFADVYTPFQVGDSIEVGSYAGKVIEINAMATVLLADGDRLVAVPNSLLMTEVVINSSPKAWKKLTVPITLPASVDLPRVENEILKSVAKLRLRLDKRFPPTLAVKARTDRSIDLVLTVMIRRPEERDSILAELNRRVHDALPGSRVRGTEPAPPTAASAPAPPPPG